MPDITLDGQTTWPGGSNITNLGQARAMLRIAELAQAQAAPSDDSIFPSLLIPKKKKKDG